MDLQKAVEEFRKRQDEDILDFVRPKYLKRDERMQLSSKKGALLSTLPTRTRTVAANFMNNTTELSEEEKNIIKRRYMGGESNEKKVNRRGQRQVNFDWDESDDTSNQALVDKVIKGSARESGQKAIVKSVDADGNEIELVVAAQRTTFEKNNVDDLHWSKKDLKEMKERDWRILREDFGIAVGGGNIPEPIRNWQEAPLPSELLRIIVEKVQYKDPTAIQRQTIPLILKGRDVIGLAETGSGKTAAFILPMLARILLLPPLTEQTMLDGPYGLVLAPTRELALQIESETHKFCRPLGMRCISIVGGHSVAEQSVQMRRGVEIVIATPGRLCDCLEQHVLALAQCCCVVLDEADRMIDLNFEADLQYILGCLPASLEKPNAPAAEDPYQFLGGTRFRQTTMFSATMPSSVEKLARSYLCRPATVVVGSAGQAVDTIEQRLELLKEQEKDRRLLEILQEDEFDFPIIIFVNQKRTVDHIYHRLDTMGFRCVALHGGKSQEQRESAISTIRRRNRDILIATDVAGRGIDIPDISLVINFDMAKSIEDYVHRIGRTGRMGKSGTTITFLTNDDSAMFYDLRVLVQRASKSSIPQDFLSHEASRTKPGTVSQKRRHEERIFAYGV